MTKYVLLFIISFLSIGCSLVRYVPVESVRTDSVFIYRNVTSALTIKDSVYIDKTRDTVRVVIYKYVGERYSKTDTVYINKTDSVAVPYPVERELGKWEQVKMDYGGKAIGLLAVAGEGRQKDAPSANPQGDILLRGYGLRNLFQGLLP